MFACAGFNIYVVEGFIYYFFSSYNMAGLVNIITVPNKLKLVDFKYDNSNRWVLEKIFGQPNYFLVIDHYMLYLDYKDEIYDSGIFYSKFLMWSSGNLKTFENLFFTHRQSLEIINEFITHLITHKKYVKEVEKIIKEQGWKINYASETEIIRPPSF